MCIKQVIIIRKDLQMRKGKMIAQGAHASMKCLLDIAYKTKFIRVEHPRYKNRTIDYSGDFLSIPLNDVDEWLENKFTKIVVYVNSKDELLTLYNKATEAQLICSLILDSGLTEFHNESTYTAVAIGPASSKEINKITGDLKLL